MRFYYALLVLSAAFGRRDSQGILSCRTERGVEVLLWSGFVVSSRRRRWVQIRFPFRWRLLRLDDRLLLFRRDKQPYQVWRLLGVSRMVLDRCKNVLLLQDFRFLRTSSYWYWSRYFSLQVDNVRSNQRRSSAGYLWFRGMREFWRVMKNRFAGVGDLILCHDLVLDHFHKDKFTNR